MYCEHHSVNSIILSHKAFAVYILRHLDCFQRFPMYNTNKPNKTKTLKFSFLHVSHMPVS